MSYVCVCACCLCFVCRFRVVCVCVAVLLFCVPLVGVHRMVLFMVNLIVEIMYRRDDCFLYVLASVCCCLLLLFVSKKYKNKSKKQEKCVPLWYFYC